MMPACCTGAPSSVFQPMASWGTCAVVSASHSMGRPAGPDGLLRRLPLSVDFLPRQDLRLRQPAIVAIERVTAAHQAVPRRGGAIAEGAADPLPREGPPLEAVGRQLRVGEHHPPEA